MPVRLYFVRHASTGWNETGRYQGWSNPPLSLRGERKARRVAAALASAPLRAVYSSDLQRAVATARTIAEHRIGAPPPVRASPALREIHMGAWEGLTYADIERRWPRLVRAWYDDPSSGAPPGGETWAAFRERVVRFVRRIVAMHRDDDVALVTHSGVLRLLLTMVEGRPLDDMWDLSVDPGGHRVVTVEAGRFLNGK